jgi:hypothetical protein
VFVGVDGMGVAAGVGRAGVFDGVDRAGLGSAKEDCVTTSLVEVVSETGITGVESELHDDNKSNVSDRRIDFK